MEQTKNEPKNENKAAPDNGKPKKERKPLTEAQRLKRQKMIVLPAMVLVFIGAMWLIFAPSSDKEQQPGTGGYNIEMPDADKANRQIIGDKAKAYEQQQLEKRQKQRRGMVGDLSSFWDDTDVKPDTTAAPDDCRLTPAETPRKEKESRQHTGIRSSVTANNCLLYTSDAADE